MSANPAFASAVNVGAKKLTTFDTSLTGPTTYQTVFTGGSSGSRVEEITVQGAGTTVAAVVNLFLYDGSTWYLFDQFSVEAVTSSTTATAFRKARQYQNLMVPTGWTLRASHTVTGNDNLLFVTVQGADL
jgi:hypothetical protein